MSIMPSSSGEGAELVTQDSSLPDPTDLATTELVGLVPADSMARRRCFAFLLRSVNASREVQ